MYLLARLTRIKEAAPALRKEGAHAFQEDTPRTRSSLRFYLTSQVSFYSHYLLRGRVYATDVSNIHGDTKYKNFTKLLFVRIGFC